MSGLISSDYVNTFWFLSVRNLEFSFWRIIISWDFITIPFHYPEQKSLKNWFLPPDTLPHRRVPFYVQNESYSIKIKPLVWYVPCKYEGRIDRKLIDGDGCGWQANLYKGKFHALQSKRVCYIKCCSNQYSSNNWSCCVKSIHNTMFWAFFTSNMWQKSILYLNAFVFNCNSSIIFLIFCIYCE